MGLFLLLFSVFAVTTEISSAASEPTQHYLSEHCHDQDICDRESAKGVKIYDGEPGRLKCPLFSGTCNSSFAQSKDLSLKWFWKAKPDQGSEQPVDFSLPDHRIVERKEKLWFQPALLNDTGEYVCLLRNLSYCVKASVGLTVLQKNNGSCVNDQMETVTALIPIEEKQELTCPDIEEFIPPAAKYDVTWHENCHPWINGKYGNSDRAVKNNKFIFYIMREIRKGNYTCVVNYLENGRPVTLTRTINVKAVGSSRLQYKPVIHIPNKELTFTVTLGETAELLCEAYFHYLKDSATEVWWSVNGKRVDPNSDKRMKINSSEVHEQLGHKSIRRILQIDKFTSEDLKKDYTCFAKNKLGEVNSKARVAAQAYIPSIELGCGLGVTLFLMVILIVIYHVYWLELVLLYRAYFGTDETVGDGKEYDIYISYARNTEEEEFVLLTLRTVLENDWGYKVCIFDRDSLPGGNIPEDVLKFIQKSRRLIVILSPDYMTEKSISLLECRLGLLCQHTADTKIIAIRYKPVSFPSSEILQLKQTTVIKWKGEKSGHPRSRFWTRLRLALPLRTLALGVRLIDSTSSHSDLNVGTFPVKKGPSEPRKTRPASKPAAGLRTGERPRKRNGPCMTCRACVRFSERKDPVNFLSQVMPQPVWQTRLCKSIAYGTEVSWTHTRPKPSFEHNRQPVHSQTDQCCCDMTNNNNLCAL
ncbi:interleukin-1 receptor accessory protein isoform X1 [Lepisosteus oculatus]|uniref:interleukin-1 receptor accessory protein isoform X1 n=1 Tax=Lepisosteus oculatus TaxID=7918 RepID=UPI0035F524D6